MPEKAAGARKIVGGVAKAGSVALPASAAVAPIGTALSLGAGWIAQKGTEAGLNAVGVPKEYSGLAGDVAGLLAAGGGVGKLLHEAYVSAGSPEVTLGKFPQPKPFSEMSDAELINQANAIEKNPPKNYDWQKREIVKEAGARQMERGVGAPPAAPPPGAAPAGPETPVAAPTDIGDGWTANPIETEIARQERAAIAERKAKYPLPEKSEPPVAAPPAAPAASVVPKPQTVAGPEAPIGKGWTAVPAAAEAAGPAPASDTTAARQEPDSGPAAAAAPPAPAMPRGPGFEGRIPTSDIQLDPVRFQFKQEGIGGPKGVSDQFKDVRTWDPNIAGTTHVWLDPADGKTYAVNGHHRVELAQRLNTVADQSNKPPQAPDMQVRYLDAKTAAEARAQGATINIGEGNGTAIDAAKYFRETGQTPETLEAEGKLSLRKQVAKQGAALSRLSDPLFHDVVHGLLPVERAAVIGAGVPNHADQAALYTLMRQREANGKRLTDDQVGELVRMNQRTSTVTQNSGDDAQGGLFGVEEMTRPLLPEKAIVSDYVRKQLGAEKKLFGAVSTQAAADRLGEAGNVIQAGTNAQTAENANAGAQLYDKLSTKAGPIDGVLDRAAQALAKGENANDTKQAAYREIRDHLKGQLDELRGPGVRTEGVREERGGEAGSGERNPLDARGTGVDDAGGAGEVRAGEGPVKSLQAYRPETGTPSRWFARVLKQPRYPHVGQYPSHGQLAEDVGAKYQRGTLWLNRPAGELIRQALADRAGSFSGTVLKSEDAQRLADRFRGVAGNPLFAPSAKARQAIHNLADQLNRGAADGNFRAVVAMEGTGGRRLDNTVVTARHEGLHQAQMEMGGARGEAGAIDWDRFRDDPLVGRGAEAAAGLRNRSGDPATAAEVAHEVPAYIHSGEWERLGYTLDEAATVYDRYLSQVAEQHGQGTLDGVLIKAHAEIRRAIRDLRGRSDGHQPPAVLHGGRAGGVEEGVRGTGPVRQFPSAESGSSETRDIPGPEPGKRSLAPAGNRDVSQLQFFDEGEPRGSTAGEQGSVQRRESAEATAPGEGVAEGREAGPARGAGEDVPGEGRGGERGSISRKSTRTPEQIKAAADKRYGENMREWFTARRDVWAARVRQQMDLLRKELPNVVDREGLYLMRDMRHRPGELAQYLAGTHPVFGEAPRLDLANANIQKLRPAIERAMNPTPAMLKADSVLTRIAEVSLREGQKLGFIDHHVSPDEYVTHLLEPEGEKPGLADLMGRAMGGKIGRNFPFNQERLFPTILEAIAHNQRPKTLDALKAFDTYGDKFATARATHLLIHQLRESDTGIWGSRKDKGIPRDWVEIAPHAHVFRDPVAYLDAEGKPASAYRTLFVPRKIEAGLRPITDPAYMNKVAGFYAVRGAQAYTKAAQLGLSFFHATTENYMALANMGARGWLKGLKADRDAPGFLEQEADFIGHGGTTPVQGKAYEAAEGLTLSSLPTAGEAWRSMAGVRHVERAAKAITDLTFGKLQRQFKVVDYSLHQAAWLAKHPNAMPSEREAAMRSISKEINAVYGGLHSENLGMNKSTQDVARAIMLAPDWTLSNLFNLKYAAEGGTPAGKMARLFWLRAIVGGMVGTQLMSLLLSGKLSKRPTQAHLGTDPDGKEIYQNLFFKGAPGDLANTIGNIQEYGAIEGLLRTMANKEAPLLHTYDELKTNRNFLGRELVPHGMNPVASTVRTGYEGAKGLAPIPWSIANTAEMLFGPESHKYKIPLEVLTTLFAGTPPSHVSPAKPEKASQSILDQIWTGKVAAPREPKPVDPVQQMKREQRRELNP